MAKVRLNCPSSPARQFGEHRLVLASVAAALLPRVVADAGYWSHTGPCQVAPDESNCMTSPNFGQGNYSNSEACTMEWRNSDGDSETWYLHVEYFETQSGRDIVTFQGVEYSGRGEGLAAARFNLTSALTWRSDGSITASGWKLCAREFNGELPKPQQLWWHPAWRPEWEHPHWPHRPWWWHPDNFATSTSTSTSTTRPEEPSRRFWTVSGPCQIVPDEPECVTSPNWPGNYGNSESCTMTIAIDRAMYIQVVSFHTERVWDHLDCNGRSYSGDGSEIAKLNDSPLYGAITWTTDGSNTDAGWKICARERSSPYWNVVGPCRVPTNEPACVTSPNFPYNYNNDESCTMRMPHQDTMFLQAWAFHSEKNRDILTVNGREYSGDGQGLVNVNHFVPFIGTVTWKTDSSITETGWKICAYLTPVVRHILLATRGSLSLADIGGESNAMSDLRDAVVLNTTVVSTTMATTTTSTTTSTSTTQTETLFV